METRRESLNHLGRLHSCLVLCSFRHQRSDLENSLTVTLDRGILQIRMTVLHPIVEFPRDQRGHCWDGSTTGDPLPAACALCFAPLRPAPPPWPPTWPSEHPFRFANLGGNICGGGATGSVACSASKSCKRSLAWVNDAISWVRSSSKSMILFSVLAMNLRHSSTSTLIGRLFDANLAFSDSDRRQSTAAPECPHPITSRASSSLTTLMRAASRVESGSARANLDGFDSVADEQEPVQPGAALVGV